MLTEASAAIGGIKVAMDMAKGIGALKTEAEINQAIIDIQRTLLEAQVAALDDKQRMSELVSQVEALELRLKKINDLDDVTSRYVLTRSELGAFTYDLKRDFCDDEIFHRLCATCFNAEKKSILHTKAKHSGGEIVICQQCTKELTLSDFKYDFSTINRSRDDDDY